MLTNDLDVDSGDTKTVVAVNGEAPNVGKPLIGTYGTLTLLANGSWSYALDNADPDTNALAQGQTATDVFTYTMADASGATSSAPLTIAITGTNDAPDIVIRSGDSATANLTETGAGLTTSGTMTVRDPDLTDAVTASVTAVALSGTTGGLTAADVLGMLSVTPGSIAADPGDTNNLGWAFNSGAQAFNFLNSGDTLTLAYTVQATDGSASDAQTVTVNITGTAGPAAHDDTILVSNSTTVIIPWSALLANDSDPNATITGVTNLNGVTGGTIPVTSTRLRENNHLHHARHQRSYRQYLHLYDLQWLRHVDRDRQCGRHAGQYRRARHPRSVRPRLTISRISATRRAATTRSSAARAPTISSVARATTLISLPSPAAATILSTSPY